MSPYRIPFLLALPAALLAGLSPAYADAVHEIRGGIDGVRGSVDVPGEVERFPIVLSENTLLSITVKAAKGSALKPDLRILGPDRTEDAAATGAVTTSRKGNAVALKKHRIDSTGMRWLEIRGADGTTGGWELKTKVKIPKKETAEGNPLGSDGEFLFTAPAGAYTTMTVVAGKGGGPPSFLELLDPSGATLLVDDIAATKKGFTVRPYLLETPGTYTLRFTAAGPFKARASFKVLKPSKRVLDEDSVITDPVVLAVTPSGGAASEIVDGTVTVDFAKPGAGIIFRTTNYSVGIPSSSIVVGEHETAFNTPLASFRVGTYDLEFYNPDGGMDILPAVFTVTEAEPSPTGVTPSYGYDSEVLTIAVGGQFLSGSEIRLERDAEVIEGLGETGSASSWRAQFDLRGHTPGFWDVVVEGNFGTAVLDAAFEIQNSPPILDSLTPGDNLGGASVDVVIEGSYLDATPTALLRRSGSADIAGTGVAWISGTEMHATFDTTGAVPGVWDLVVANPDGKSATMAGAFDVVGPRVSLTATNPADAPISVAYNATRNEFAAAWVETASGLSSVRVQRLTAGGTPIGTPVLVSTSSGTAAKKDAAISWSSSNNQYLVCWAEVRPFSTTDTKHPSYQYVSTGVYLVVAQRLAGADLASLGGNVLISDHSNPASWYMDEFNNFRPVLAWDPSGGAWDIVWLQEWDTSGTYSTDDYDIAFRTMSASSGSLGTLTLLASSPYHEGDPAVAYDPTTGSTVKAWNSNDSSSGSGSYNLVVEKTQIHVDTSAHIADIRLAPDPDSGRILATWTRKPLSGGSRSIQGVLLDSSSPTTMVGSVVTISGGSYDEFLARPAYNTARGEGVVAWTVLDGSNLSAVMRRIDTGTYGTLTLVGSEMEVSGGSGNEATPTVAVESNSGATTLFWMKTMNLLGSGAYKGSVVTGTYTGQQMWIHRYGADW